ncbi:pyridoxamine 5'-phosphate oxidase family protein [Methanocaldococcus fervens]|uniref:Pyridoxamine 5'-phosphate oxidase-related FMN-binding n=1 Tax=Methanocaldococcus fervens (strain DSM 4213 / JCM 15782 / AG86) TaxID=573064 RepID=C7P7D0_METFA|nr:pyridoxamine 5'-phosphate oxidase family protein [Methanocaldococcus fervens]ACV24462.1 pyridoxamine 5'-phosphate oxidase-related FMN-binding [Methanocaldococcus fervens AG86]
MVKLSEDMVKSLENEIVFLATSSKEGIPNVAPMKAVKVLDAEKGMVLIADNFMNKTLKNILENPNVALTTANCREMPYQYKGVAEYYKEGEYLKIAEELDKALRPDFKPKGAVVIKITEIYNLKSGPDAGKLIAKDE